METNARAVLVVDDEPDMAAVIELVLREAGITEIVKCTDSRELETLLQTRRFRAVTLDLGMPHMTSDALLDLVLDHAPQTPVIIITGVDDVDSALRCISRGAFDYLVKPIESGRLILSVRNALANSDAQYENSELRDRLLSGKLANPVIFAEIRTKSRAMEALFRYVEAIARTPLPVLVTGETGVGKELMARALHRASGRAGAFVAVNVAGLDDALFSDTLFGHVKGAFTGADRPREGMIAAADNGTVFLDEIGDLRAESQIKLLRLLREKEFYRIGEDSPRRTAARFVFGTNRDLDAMTTDGQFRRDLYYRLKSHQVAIPPLRERRGDIPILLDFFVQKAAGEIGKKPPAVRKEAILLLSRYPFPGNIRELEGMVYDAVVRDTDGALGRASFEQVAHAAENPTVTEGFGLEPQQSANPFSILDELPTIRAANDLLIDEALRRAGGNQGTAARALGISRTALNRRLRGAG